MDEAKTRAERIITLLQAKADRTDNVDEKDAIERKITELRARYNVPKYPLPWSPINPGDPWITVNKVQWTSRDEFIHSFFGAYPDHITIVPTREGKTYFATWLADMDSNPSENEEGWEIIDNWQEE